MQQRFHPLLAFAGFAVWAGAFLTIYAAQNLGCRFGWGDTKLMGLSAHRLLLVGLYFTTIIAIGALTFLSWRAVYGRQGKGWHFFGPLALWSNNSALGVAAIVFAPTLFLPPC